MLLLVAREALEVLDSSRGVLVDSHRGERGVIVTATLGAPEIAPLEMHFRRRLVGLLGVLLPLGSRIYLAGHKVQLLGPHLTVSYLLPTTGPTGLALSRRVPILLLRLDHML